MTGTSVGAGAGHPPPARTALVTGASRGIGRHLALGLADAGLDVGLLARDRGALEEVARAVVDRGRRAHPVTADVTDLSVVESAVAEVERELGPVDLLVNNAGRIESTEVPPWQADPEEWWAVVETNLRGSFHLVRAVVPGMLERGGGRVVDLSTGSATRDSALYSAYFASKTALLRFGSGLHLAGHERGLRVLEIAPGVVRTEMTAGMRVHDDRTDWTDPQAVVDLVVAAARGGLDEWSGRYVRAGADDPASLAAAAAVLDGPAGDDARTLRLRPWGDDDPAV
ncbi:SDR family NAD(P)-dependent oxidoreductase [Thalassiella azotivora]